MLLHLGVVVSDVNGLALLWRVWEGSLDWEGLRLGVSCFFSWECDDELDAASGPLAFL